MIVDDVQLTPEAVLQSTEKWLFKNTMNVFRARSFSEMTFWRILTRKKMTSFKETVHVEHGFKVIRRANFIKSHVFTSPSIYTIVIGL